MNEPLKPEDYREPVCPLSMDRTERIDVRRAVEKLDGYLGRNDYDGALRHLEYWLREAEACGDLRGELTLQNELMGLHRKCGRREEAVRAAERSLGLTKELGLENSVTGATVCVNAATVYKAFGETEKALSLYGQALSLYEKLLPPDDARFGGLYNNLALALTDAGEYEKARACYRKAVDVMAQTENGAPEQAVSYLNLADTVRLEKGMEAGEAEIEGLLAKAEALLNTPSLPRDGNYAFVCEKCAPAFSYYGYFLFAEELKRRAKSIYEGS